MDGVWFEDGANQQSDENKFKKAYPETKEEVMERVKEI